MSLTDVFEAVTTDNDGGDVLVAPRLPLSDGLPGAAAPAVKALLDEQMLDQMVAQVRAEGGRLTGGVVPVNAVRAGESSVACLAELVGGASTAVSQHLAKLRLAGLVRGRREGTFVHYSAADTHVRALLSEALFHAEHTDQNARTTGTSSGRSGRNGTGPVARCTAPAWRPDTHSPKGWAAWYRPCTPVCRLSFPVLIWSI